MNISIIKKCLDELAKPEFRKDYVVGMLETLYELGGGAPVYNGPTAAGSNNTVAEFPKEPFAAGSKKGKLKKEDAEEEVPEFLRAGKVGNLTQS